MAYLYRMVSYIIWTILLYLLFRFIVNFVIPIFRVTKQMREQVKGFQEKMNTEQQHASANQQQTNNRSSAPKARKEDYIDFEEIK